MWHAGNDSMLLSQVSNTAIMDRSSRGRQKFTFSAKANASKEIEAWGRDYGSLADSTMRGAGQLTENVTEARMLQSKIMEMSKERYKYMNQASFGMKFFLDAQTRKTRLMPRLLHGVDISYWLSKKSVRHVPKFSSSASNARFAFLDRMETSGEKCKDFAEEENPFDIPQRPKVPDKQLPEFYRIRLKEQEEEELAKTTFSTQPVLRPQTQKSVKFCSSTAGSQSVRLPGVTQSARSTPSVRSQPSSNKQDDRQILRRAQSGPASQRSVDDRRYRNLQQSLSGRYTSSAVDASAVQSIINAQDSLHVPSRLSSQKSRPKLQKTILEYLRAKGFEV